MEKKEVVEQLNTILAAELKELRDTMDCFDEPRVEFPEDNAPMLNLQAEDGHYVNWIVRAVTWKGEDDVVRINAHLFDCPYRPDEKDETCNKWFNYEDEEFSNALIPGELTKLTEAIEKAERRYQERLLHQPLRKAEREKKYSELCEALRKAQNAVDDFVKEQVWLWQQRTLDGTLELRDDDNSWPKVDVYGHQLGFDEVKFAGVFTDYADAEPEENWEYDGQLYFKVCCGDEAYPDGTWLKEDDFDGDDWAYLVPSIKFPDETFAQSA